MTATHDALECLRRADTRVTPARAAVIEALAGEEHLTAPEIVARVTTLAPAVSRASVYRALDLLTRLGICQAATMGGVVARYTLAPTGAHHHLVCVVCQKALDFERCGAGDLLIELEARTGFRIHGHLLEAYGLCPACQNALPS